MWDKPNQLLELPDNQSTSISPVKSTEPVTIETIISNNNDFWKTMHPSYQKIYEMGRDFSKIDNTTHITLLQSQLQSITSFYRNQIIQSKLSNDLREEEFKKLKLFESQIEHMVDIFKLFKLPFETESLVAFLLGYNLNLYKLNKDLN